MILACGFASMANMAQAHDAHVHGIGKLDVAVEGATLSLHLDSPLANLLGFEHAPKTQKERAAAQQMVKRLRDADRVFVPTAAAACKLESVQLASSALDAALLQTALADKRTEAHEEGHADLDGDFAFRCAFPERLKSVEVRLFDAFKGFRRLDVQLVTPKKQSAAVLTPAARQLSW
jgi:hypothetical protein